MTKSCEFNFNVGLALILFSRLVSCITNTGRNFFPLLKSRSSSKHLNVALRTRAAAAIVKSLSRLPFFDGEQLEKCAVTPAIKLLDGEQRKIMS